RNERHCDHGASVPYVARTFRQVAGAVCRETDLAAGRRIAHPGQCAIRDAPHHALDERAPDLARIEAHVAKRLHEGAPILDDAHRFGARVAVLAARRLLAEILGSAAAAAARVAAALRGGLTGLAPRNAGRRLIEALERIGAALAAVLVVEVL